LLHNYAVTENAPAIQQEGVENNQTTCSDSITSVVDAIANNETPRQQRKRVQLKRVYNTQQTAATIKMRYVRRRQCGRLTAARRAHLYTPLTVDERAKVDIRIAAHVCDVVDDIAQTLHKHNKIKLIVPHDETVQRKFW
jgi:hypothetical protein